MNEFERVPAEQLDRLVDGELSDIQRREVLLALESEADGWRRLALAFVESQVLHQDLLHGGEESSVKPQLFLPQAPTFAFAGVPWRAHAALAVCALLLFGLGRWSTQSSPETARIARPVDATPRTYDASIPGQVLTGAEQELVADANNPLTSTEQTTMRLELDDHQGGPVQVIDVPVVEQASVSPEDLLNAPSAISEEIQRVLQKSGRRIHEQRQLYEVRFRDGRRGIVPISDVHVDGTGWELFQ